ncbi:MAG: hypothetical protein MESAZ_02483 [Saezia sanguinis]
MKPCMALVECNIREACSWSFRSGLFSALNEQADGVLEVLHSVSSG